MALIKKIFGLAPKILVSCTVVETEYPHDCTFLPYVMLWLLCPVYWGVDGVAFITVGARLDAIEEWTMIFVHGPIKTERL